MFAPLYASIAPVLAKQPAWNSWSRWYFYVIFGFIFLGIILGTWAGAVAGRKGRSMQWWFVIGFFIPVIGVVASYAVKPKPAGKKKEATKQPGQPG